MIRVLSKGENSEVLCTGEPNGSLLLVVEKKDRSPKEDQTYLPIGQCGKVQKTEKSLVILLDDGSVLNMFFGEKDRYRSVFQTPETFCVARDQLVVRLQIQADRLHLSGSYYWDDWYEMERQEIIDPRYPLEAANVVENNGWSGSDSPLERVQESLGAFTKCTTTDRFLSLCFQRWKYPISLGSDGLGEPSLPLDMNSPRICAPLFDDRLVSMNLLHCIDISGLFAFCEANHFNRYDYQYLCLIILMGIPGIVPSSESETRMKMCSTLMQKERLAGEDLISTLTEISPYLLVEEVGVLQEMIQKLDRAFPTVLVC